MDYSKVVIIAEAGVNHNGDINLARQLIKAGAEAGVDYVKFQTWITEELIDLDAPKAKYQIENDGAQTSQYQMLKKLELSYSDFRELKTYAEQIGVGFLSTPDDYPSLDFLADELKLPILKVSSGEITNIPYLRRVGSKKCDVILSTGMAGIGEVERAYNTLVGAGAKSVAILHCTSNYPAAYDSVNLGAMTTLRAAFNTTVGYSDHTAGNEVSIAAVALGAQIIEKHFTLDKSMDGPDHRASIDVPELQELVKAIRHVEAAISGDGRKAPHHSEAATKAIFVKGIYARVDLSAGTVICDDHLALKRPNAGVSAEMYDLVVGRKLKCDIRAKAPLQFADIFGE